MILLLSLFRDCLVLGDAKGAKLTRGELFLKYFIYLFIVRVGKRGREREKHQCVVASSVSPTGDLARNPGMCPDWESNR